MNKQTVNKIYCPLKVRQMVLKDDLMSLLSHYAGFERKRENFLWKIHARDNGGSVVTVTLYTSGNVICMGHGNLFDLTSRMVCLYDNPITHNGFGAKPKAVRKGRNLNEKKER